MAVIGPLFAVADLRGLRFTGLIGWLVWGLAHLAFMPDMENRLSLLLKWLWQIGTRERDSMLIIGSHNQHLGVEVGLELRETTADLVGAEDSALKEVPKAAAAVASATAEPGAPDAPPPAGSAP